jgi:glycosyltransferase involved in cell wall biosynthesis
MAKSKQKPLVSCISPSFRMERYMKHFLDRLPEQTIFDRLQIVLDHNEPTEQELTWVREFDKKHPGVIKHNIVDPVEPIGTSMNRCINLADGDFVAIWNIDDLRTPDSLEKQVAVLQKNLELNVCHGNFVIVNSFPFFKGKLVDHSQYRYNKKEYTRSMVLGPFFMWRKLLCEKAGKFDEQLRSGADFDLAIRLAIHGNVGIAHGILGYYLDEGAGASTRGDMLQPIERTLIEVRYGIYDKVEHHLMPEINNRKYAVEKVVFDNIVHSIETFVPDYANFRVTNSKPDPVV